MNRRVLVVDFDVKSAASTKSLLEAQGCEVLPVRSPRELQTAFADQLPPLVVIEPMLPGQDSLALCRRFKRSGETPPTVILASRIFKGATLQSMGYSAGANMVFERPREDQALLDAVCGRAVVREPPPQNVPAGALLDDAAVADGIEAAPLPTPFSAQVGLATGGILAGADAIPSSPTKPETVREKDEVDLFLDRMFEPYLTPARTEASAPGAAGPAPTLQAVIHEASVAATTTLHEPGPPDPVASDAGPMTDEQALPPPADDAAFAAPGEATLFESTIGRQSAAPVESVEVPAWSEIPLSPRPRSRVRVLAPLAAAAAAAGVLLGVMVIRGGDMREAGGSESTFARAGAIAPEGDESNPSPAPTEAAPETTSAPVASLTAPTPGSIRETPGNLRPPRPEPRAARLEGAAGASPGPASRPAPAVMSGARPRPDSTDLATPGAMSPAASPAASSSTTDAADSGAAPAPGPGEPDLAGAGSAVPSADDAGASAPPNPLPLDGPAGGAGDAAETAPPGAPAAAPPAPILEPELIRATQVLPVYPTVARQLQARGQIVLQAEIRADGVVGDVKVLKDPNPRLGFAKAAITAVKKWRYRPATQAGLPVPCSLTVVVNFAP